MSASKNVVALVNPKSGGKRAAVYVLEKMKTELGDDKVLALFVGPDPARFAADAKSFLVAHRPDEVIVAGGDGTISFAMDIIKELHDEHLLESAQGVVAPFPLGTGNDLCFTLGYGGGFARWVVLGGPRFRRMMRLFRKSKAIQLDRWHLVVKASRAAAESRTSPSPSPSPPAVIAKKVMNNYFSVGFDAAIAERLNSFRQRHPQYFLTRPLVKLWYAYFAALALLTEKPLAGTVSITLDGKPLSYPRNTKALVVANMITYAGGSILWGPNNKTERSLYQSPSLTDGKVEVAALSGVWHLAFVRLGLCFATKLGQGEVVQIVSSAANHHQYDGEPIALPPASQDASGVGDEVSFEIRYFSNSDVLQAHLPRRHVFSILLATAMVIAAVAVLASSVLSRCYPFYAARA